MSFPPSLMELPLVPSLKLYSEERSDRAEEAQLMSSLGM
jgi:hypothetical protein